MKRASPSGRTAWHEIRMSFTFAAFVSLALGVLFLLAPDTSRMLLCVLFSAGVLICGALNLLSFFAARGEKSFTLQLPIGVCAFSAGLCFLFNPAFLMDFLFIVMGMMVLVISLSSVRRALRLKSFGFGRWPLSLGLSIACMVFALTIILYPALYGRMLMTIMGVLLVVQSVSDLLSIMFLSRYSMYIRIRDRADE